jgi:hypothetical protein
MIRTFTTAGGGKRQAGDDQQKAALLGRPFGFAAHSLAGGLFAS